MIVVINKIDLLRGHRNINVLEKIYHPPPPAAATATLGTTDVGQQSVVDQFSDGEGVVLSLKERILRRKRSRDFTAAVGLNPASTSIPTSDTAFAGSDELSSSKRSGKDAADSLDYTEDDTDDEDCASDVDIRDVEWKPKQPPQPEQEQQPYVWDPLVPGSSGVFHSAEEVAWGGSRDTSSSERGREIRGVDELISIWKSRLPNAGENNAVYLQLFVF